MLTVDNINYTASATSTNEDGEVLATMTFTSDKRAGYYFNVNVTTKEALANKKIDADFADFKKTVASMVENQIKDTEEE